MIYQNNFPMFLKREPEEGVMISAVKLVGDDSTWHDFDVKTQSRLVYDADGRIEVVVSYEGCNNTFEFTKDSVKRLSHRGALLDLCWVDFVDLAEGEVQSITCPDGVKAVGTPWILARPSDVHDVGREADWVFEDKTMALVKEQWREEIVARFCEENREGPRYWCDVRAIALFVKEKERHVKKCFGLFQGVPPQIRFWTDNYSAVTWGSITFRRHTLDWSGEIDGENGTVSLRVKTPGVEVELAVQMTAVVLGGDSRRLGDARLAVMGARALNPADYVRAIAEMEAASYKARRRNYKPPHPTPRTSKRGIFSKR